MTPVNWQDPSSATVTTIQVGSNPWFGISMGLLGLIIGFGLHRFIVPMARGAQAAPPSIVTQGLVVQPSPTKPPPSTGGGGCGCGGGGCGALAPAAPGT